VIKTKSRQKAALFFATHSILPKLLKRRKPNPDTLDAWRCLACGEVRGWVVLHRDSGEIVVRVCRVCGYEEVVEE